MKWDELSEIGRALLPEVKEGIWYRTPSLEVRGKSFVRLKENGSDVVFLLDDVDEQQFLIETRPAIYHITDHYRGHAAVLARLSKLPVAECRVRLEQGWRKRAPKAVVRAFDEARAGVGVRKTKARKR